MQDQDPAGSLSGEDPHPGLHRAILQSCPHLPFPRREWPDHSGVSSN